MTNYLVIDRPISGGYSRLLLLLPVVTLILILPLIADTGISTCYTDTADIDTIDIDNKNIEAMNQLTPAPVLYFDIIYSS